MGHALADVCVGVGYTFFLLGISAVWVAFNTRHNHPCVLKHAASQILFEYLCQVFGGVGGPHSGGCTFGWVNILRELTQSSADVPTERHEGGEADVAVLGVQTRAHARTHARRHCDTAPVVAVANERRKCQVSAAASQSTSRNIFYRKYTV